MGICLGGLEVNGLITNLEVVPRRVNDGHVVLLVA